MFQPSFMKYHLALIIISLLSIGCDSEENRSKQRLQEIETLQEKIGEFAIIDDYESAIKICSQIIELDSTNAEHYDNRRGFHTAAYSQSEDSSNKKKHLELAYEDATKSILLTPNYRRYLSRASIAQKLFDDKKLALDDYDFAVEKAKEDKHCSPLCWRGKFFFYELKDSLRAFQDMESLIEQSLKEKDPFYRIALIMNYYEMLMDSKEFQRAEKEILDIIEYAKEKGINLSESYYEELVHCKIELGNYSGALITVETTNLRPDFKDHYKGYCLFKMGKIQEGKQLMLTARNLVDNGTRQKKTDSGKFMTSKYFIEVFPDYMSDSTLITTPTWSWPAYSYDRTIDVFF